MHETPLTLNSANPTDPSKTIARGAWLVLLAAFLGWMFDGLEQGIFPLIARPALNQMLGASAKADSGKWMGYITAAWLVGAAVGGFIFGWLGDRIGRVRSMALSVLAYSAFTGLGYFAVHPWHLMVLRIFAGLGMGGEWSLGVALVMECWPDARRPLLAGLIGMSANLGFVMTAALGLVHPVTESSWRWVMLAGISPAVLTFLIRLFVPESERWQHSVAISGPAKPISEVLRMPLLRRTLLGIGLSSVALIGTWGAIQLSIPPWVTELAHNDPSAKAVSLILIAIGASISGFASALLAGRFGRRITYFALCLGSLIACGLLFRCFHTFNIYIKIMIFIVGALTASFFGWLPLYLPELFPTRVRATGQGIAYNTGRIFAAAGAIWGGRLVDAYGGDYAASARVITLVYLVGMAIIWFAPETKGRALPE